MHFQHTFLLQRISCPQLISTIFPCQYYGLVIKCTKSHHPNQCIKVRNPLRLCCLWFIPFFFFFFFFVTRHDCVNRSWLVQTFSLMYEQTLFNYSNTQSEQRIHFLHNPFFIGPDTRNATPLLEQWSKTKATCSYFTSLVSLNWYISTLVLLFCTHLFHDLFSMCYTFQTDNY